ncbi:MAG TPA: threonine/serine dehydratase [Bdellovibrionota bacterium]|nr:threonine/serine dehydratase [Bdellovibrionota bacterium]
MSASAISRKLLFSARERLNPHLRSTPLVPGFFAQGPVWLKLETQQPTGSFKVRPALNGILAHEQTARKQGIIASSSGNFAQAVAYAAKSLGCHAQIVMMQSTSEYKISRTRDLGAEVVLCGASFQERWDTTYRLQRETGRLLLHPYDSPDTISGDATLGLELLEQLPGDFTCIVPVSGGGLLAGIALALKTARPGCRVIGVQPEANPSMKRALESGEREEGAIAPSIADALIAVKPGALPFEIAQKYVDEIVLVTEAEIVEALRVLTQEQKLVVEPGAAVTVAAVLSGKISTRHMATVCVLSGGNIQPENLLRLAFGTRPLLNRVP